MTVRDDLSCDGGLLQMNSVRATIATIKLWFPDPKSMRRGSKQESEQVLQHNCV